jgi:hypothetical protein
MDYRFESLLDFKPAGFDRFPAFLCGLDAFLVALSCENVIRRLSHCRAVRPQSTEKRRLTPNVAGKSATLPDFRLRRGPPIT